jgi:hypothetical protein
MHRPTFKVEPAPPNVITYTPIAKPRDFYGILAQQIAPINARILHQQCIIIETKRLIVQILDHGS